MTRGHIPVRPASACQQELPELPCARGEKMTKEQFKEWLKKIDSDGDGVISRDELRGGLRERGINCSIWRSWRAMVHADLNGNKVVEGDQEIEELIKYVGKRWGIVVVG